MIDTFAVIGDSRTGFSASQVERFARDGYVIVRGLGDPAMCASMRALAQAQLDGVVGPVEHEADLHYPGAPVSREAGGGRTVRRLLQACARDRLFLDWATSSALGVRLGALLGGRPMLAQAHHNCIMTKDPRYSSRTGWHQDIRYWSFQRPELVSAWLALGPENADNGCLQLVPGSHTMSFDRERFDDMLFFRQDLTQNREVLATAVDATLEPGDVLFFHCRLLHAAGWNRTAQTKLSAVFTFHAEDNRPLSGSRSASQPSLPVQH